MKISYSTDNTDNTDNTDTIEVRYRFSGYTLKYHHFYIDKKFGDCTFHAFLLPDKDVWNLRYQIDDTTIKGVENLYYTIPKLNFMSEEQLFQESMIWDLPVDFYAVLAFQRFVNECINTSHFPQSQILKIKEY